jgi:hypothetical protein
MTMSESQAQAIKVEVLQPEIVKEQINAVIKTSGLAEDSALSLRGQFANYYGEIVTWREKASLVTKPEDQTHQKIAREVRLGLRKIRCEVENVRKALKAESLARGKAIDGFANVLKYLCEPVEEQLAAVEQYAERQEAARIAALVQDRTAALVAVEADPTAYNLGAMDEDTFRLVLAAAEKRRADRIETDRKAEADRVAREQADRIAREKAEKEAAEARAEVDRVLKEAAQKEAKAKAAREAAEATARAEKAKADAKFAKEREAREKAEREAAEAKHKEQARVAAETAAVAAKVWAEREAAEKAARAPDKAKVLAFAATVRGLIVDIPEGKTAAGKTAFDAIEDKCEAFASWIEKQAESL